MYKGTEIWVFLDVLKLLWLLHIAYEKRMNIRGSVSPSEFSIRAK